MTLAPPRLLVGASALLFAASCDSGDPAPTTTIASTELRIAGVQTGGSSGDALASALLLSTGSTVPRTGRIPFQMADAALEDELRFRATSHLEAGALASGTGPRLEGSARIRRLALSPGAPADRNGNGSNLDETLDAELLSLAHTAGAVEVPALRPFLFSWSQGMADLAQDPGHAGRGEYAAFGAEPSPPGTVTTEQIGHAMLARVHGAARLLSQSRGSFAGANPDEGLLGLLLMQQAVAIEETLLQDLFFNGAMFGNVEAPSTYDPRTEPPVWLVRRFAVAENPAVPLAPAGYAVDDRASSLGGLAAVLSASSELAWIASPLNQNPVLRDVLTGNPFGLPPGTSRPRPGQGLAAAGASEFNWQEDIGPLLAFRCGGCHYESLPEFNEFVVLTYQSTLAGGVSAPLGYPSVVPGNHQASLLWQVLVGATPVAEQMPQGEAPLPPEEIAQIAEWIDAGAPEFPAVPPPAPMIGVDLARVLVRNLDVLHLDPATGALHDRFDGDVPNGFAAATSTGDALLALVAYVTAVPADAEARTVLARAAEAARVLLATPEGQSWATFEIASGTPGAAADLHGHARLCAGVLAAGRVLGGAELLERGRALGRALLQDYFDPASALFRTELGRAGRQYGPETTAAVLDALRELVADGAVPGAQDAHDRFLGRLRPQLAFAEWDGHGEVLGDGIADTDGNGIAEPALAGGEHGRAPLLAGEILEGPDPLAEAVTGPVTWSEHIQPLFRANCATGCHLDGAQQGLYRLDTPALLRQPGESGGAFPLVVPGDPAGSLLYRKLAERPPPVGLQMPYLRPPLDPRGRELVRRWILEGATSR